MLVETPGLSKLSWWEHRLGNLGRGGGAGVKKTVDIYSDHILSLLLHLLRFIWWISLHWTHSVRTKRLSVV